MNFVVESERDLIEKVWGSLKKKARAGVRIGLSGDLGAGKTTFISGIAKILGVKELVTSPTFAISKIYKTDSKNLPSRFNATTFMVSSSNIETSFCIFLIFLYTNI